MIITVLISFVKILKIMLDFSLVIQYNNKVAKAYAAMAQEVERILGKDEVTSSTLVISSKKS